MLYLLGADEELRDLKARAPLEALAVVTAVDKLQQLGTILRFPHCSHGNHVQGSEHLWELRPRSGRSPWRAFY